MNRRRFLQQSGLLGSGCRLDVRIAAVSDGRSAAETSAPGATAGPLRVHPQNGRYFGDGAGRAVYLTGAHTWNNLSDVGIGDPPTPFDFPKYLAFLAQHHLNFIRLWRWELTRWDVGATPAVHAQDRDVRRGAASLETHGSRRGLGWPCRSSISSNSIRRISIVSGSGCARPKTAASTSSIMLFEGWGLQHLAEAWKSHPFHPSNNIQALDGDAGGDGRGLLTHTLKLPAVTRLQEAYVRHLMDTVNDLDNVLYEIINESGVYSIEWQYHLIRFIKA